MEQFADGDDIDQEIDDTLKDVLGEIAEDEDNQEDLAKKCENLGNGGFGSITSKYSGKSINVEALLRKRCQKKIYDSMATRR